jgi:hypothetical protein
MPFGASQRRWLSWRSPGPDLNHPVALLGRPNWIRSGTCLPSAVGFDVLQQALVSGPQMRGRQLSVCSSNTIEGANTNGD